MPIIHVAGFSKHFKVYEKEPGTLGSLRALIHRKYYQKKAVDNISFDIEEGELIGFIGPNGAGKTTTLKCLSGLLHPTAGTIKVAGYTPFERNHKFLRKISLVMGQKQQLWWDLPAQETFLLNKEIYQIPDQEYSHTLDELVRLLDAQDILKIQVRQLSLGQRMKCELIAALIHSPRILFLDEPTIGLDVTVQKSLRDFIKEYNHKHKATIILTSHYMKDVEALARRVIIINHGTILYDGKLRDIVRKFSQEKLLWVTFEKPIERKDLEKLGKIKMYKKYKTALSVPRTKAKNIATHLLAKFPVDDINIEEPEIEDVIREVFIKQ